MPARAVSRGRRAGCSATRPRSRASRRRPPRSGAVAVPATCSSNSASRHRVVASHIRRPSIVACPMRPIDHRRSGSSLQSMNVRCSDPAIWTQVPGRPESTRRCHAWRCRARSCSHHSTDENIFCSTEIAQGCVISGCSAKIKRHGRSTAARSGSRHIPPSRLAQATILGSVPTHDRGRRAAEGVAECTDSPVIDPSTERAGVVVEARRADRARTEGRRPSCRRPRRARGRLRRGDASRR